MSVGRGRQIRRHAVVLAALCALPGVLVSAHSASAEDSALPACPNDYVSGSIGPAPPLSQIVEGQPVLLTVTTTATAHAGGGEVAVANSTISSPQSITVSVQGSPGSGPLIYELKWTGLAPKPDGGQRAVCEGLLPISYTAVPQEQQGPFARCKTPTYTLQVPRAATVGTAVKARIGQGPWDQVKKVRDVTLGTELGAEMMILAGTGDASSGLRTVLYTPKQLGTRNLVLELDRDVLYGTVPCRDRITAPLVVYPPGSVLGDLNEREFGGRFRLSFMPSGHRYPLRSKTAMITPGCIAGGCSGVINIGRFEARLRFDRFNDRYSAVLPRTRFGSCRKRGGGTISPAFEERVSLFFWSTSAGASAKTRGTLTIRTRELRGVRAKCRLVGVDRRWGMKVTPAGKS